MSSLVLARRDVKVDHTGDRIGQVGQLVIVRGEERLRPRARIRGEIFGDGPRDAQTVERGRPAADFVQHDQASRRGEVQDRRRLLHLHHERRVPASDVIRGADPREDAIDQRQLGFPRRHERARLRHQAHERRLPKICGLAAHVGTGQDHQLMAARIQRDVVRYERVAHVPFDDGMTSVHDEHLVTVVHVWLRVVADRGGLGQRGEHVARSDSPCRRLDRAGHRRDLGPQRLEQLDFALENPLVGAEHLLFVVLECRGNEPLAAGDCLLAQVVGRDVVQIRLRDFYVIAEDPIEANLERRDAGARALGLLHLGDHLLAGAAYVTQLVELAIDAVANHAAVASKGRRFVHEHRVEPRSQLGQIVELRREARNQRRLQRCEQHARPRDGAEGYLQSRQIPRAGDAESGARDQALQVVHELERFPNLGAFDAVERQLLDRVQAVADRLECDKRPEQPRAQEAAAHWRHRQIQFVEQGSSTAAFRPLHDFEVLQRYRIDQQMVGLLTQVDARHVSQIGFLGFAQVADEGSSGLRGCGMALEAEALQTAGVQLLSRRAAPLPRRSASHRSR